MKFIHALFAILILSSLSGCDSYSEIKNLEEKISIIQQHNERLEERLSLLEKEIEEHKKILNQTGDIRTLYRKK